MLLDGSHWKIEACGKHLVQAHIETGFSFVCRILWS